MTKDVIALTPKMPDRDTILAGLYAGGPDTRLATHADGALIQLCTNDGHPMVTVEAPQLIHHPSEITRLLGPDAPTPEGPVWWTEARADTAITGADRLAASFAGRLATVLDGTVWPPGPLTTDVVTPDTTAGAPGDSTPSIDVLTDKAALVLHDRPLVALTSWLSDALRHAATNGLALQLVTTPQARLTLPDRTALAGHPNRWVVQTTDGGYYDGLSGAQLHWQEGQFAPIVGREGTLVAEAFTREPPRQERQLMLSIHTCHEPTPDLELGHALEAAWTHLTGRKPAGWSTSEPVNLPWSARQLTQLARNRAPRPTTVIAIGHPDRPAVATQRITRTPHGVEEKITMALGYRDADQLPLDRLFNFAEDIHMRRGLKTMLIFSRSARLDLTAAPALEMPPWPRTFTLGAQATQEAGETIHRMVPGVLAKPVGPPSNAGYHYRIDRLTPTAAWAALGQLTKKA